ncbi:uncharacterized protein V6R79_007679 [Siganus canaliculatus]
MGTKELFLCVLVGHFINVQSVIHNWDAAFPPDFPGFFDNFEPFPFKSQFDFTPYDPLFRSWRPQDPAFHMFPELPPLGTFNVPKVEVFCDESKLTVLVDKQAYGAALTGEEVHFGDGCFSNGDLPHQFVFSYSLEECGTTHTVENGMDMFTNLLHLNLKSTPLTWWPTPSTIQIYCIPMRSHAPNPNVVSLAAPETDKTFYINAMNPSWAGPAESNVYERGQIVNLQVSAQTRAKQQLFIQSCFVSGSPEHHTQPRHAVIMNKGCTAPLGFPHAGVQFVASNRRDVVNFVLNTTYVISELYIHCRVFLWDQGVTFSSKSCNYIAGQSRWEDVGGTPRVCDCCKSKCKGPSVKYLPEDSKAIVSIGPLVIEDKDPEQQETSTATVTNLLQSDGAVTEDRMVPDPLTGKKFSFPPQDVVVVRQDPVARLTLWLPGQVQKDPVSSESEDSLFELQADNLVPNSLPVQELLSTDQDSILNLAPNEIGPHNWNVLTLVDGWVLPPPEKAATTEGSGRKTRSGISGLFGVKAPQKVDAHVPVEQTVNDFNQVTDKLTQQPPEAAVMFLEGTNNDGPVLRSKLQFSQGLDGSQILSYEEELKQQGKGVFRKFGMSGLKREQELKKKRLHTPFLHLLR